MLVHYGNLGGGWVESLCVLAKTDNGCGQEMSH